MRHRLTTVLPLSVDSLPLFSCPEYAHLQPLKLWSTVPLHRGKKFKHVAELGYWQITMVSDRVLMSRSLAYLRKPSDVSIQSASFVR